MIVSYREFKKLIVDAYARSERSRRMQKTRPSNNLVPMTLEEIAAVMERADGGVGVSRQRIREIGAKALSKLRHPSRSGILVPFIDGPNKARAVRQVGCTHTRRARVPYEEGGRLWLNGRTGLLGW